MENPPPLPVPARPATGPLAGRLGLAKLGDVSYGKAEAWLFGIWGSLVLLSTLAGWGR